MSTVHESLNQQLRILNKNLGWKQSFIRGVMSGFGTALGAGLVVALVAIILNRLTGLPILGQVFQFVAGHLQQVR